MRNHFSCTFFVNLHIYLCEAYLKGDSVAASRYLDNVLSTPTSSKDFLLVNLFVLPITSELFQMFFVTLRTPVFLILIFQCFQFHFVICVQLICNFQICKVLQYIISFLNLYLSYDLWQSLISEIKKWMSVTMLLYIYLYDKQHSCCIIKSKTP